MDGRITERRANELLKCVDVAKGCEVLIFCQVAARLFAGELTEPLGLFQQLNGSWYIPIIRWLRLGGRGEMVRGQEGLAEQSGGIIRSLCRIGFVANQLLRLGQSGVDFSRLNQVVSQFGAKDAMHVGRTQSKCLPPVVCRLVITAQRVLSLRSAPNGVDEITQSFRMVRTLVEERFQYTDGPIET